MKVFSLAQLSDIVSMHKKDGKTIVQCHGCWDVLHVGHVLHLKEAKKLGDYLVVTVTADQYVNKGPNRPAFPIAQRMEMLTALECVDYVAFNDSLDAVPAIRVIKPDYYVKGCDYIGNTSVCAEQEAVELCGGQLVCTETEKFSSTEIINKTLNIYEPTLKTYLDRIKENCGLDNILAMLDSIRDMRVLVIGEKIIDQYDYVLPMGKTPKEHIIATRYKDTESFKGGVSATANNVRDFCNTVDVVSWNRLITKKRFVDPTYNRKLFEVCYMDDSPITQEEEDRIITRMHNISDYDVVIVNDFGHGMISENIRTYIWDNTEFMALNVQSNSANMGFNLLGKYIGADYVCLDALEARLSVQDKDGDIEDVIRRLGFVDCDNFIVTHGKHGCITSTGHSVPAITASVTDTMGAGDAFLALTSPLVARGYPLDVVAFIGNIAGALKTNIIGHKKSIRKMDVVKTLRGLLG
jgi:rfaE bifunctional protein nucleotidyltransferase chain/domain